MRFKPKGNWKPSVAPAKEEPRLAKNSGENRQPQR